MMALLRAQEASGVPSRVREDPATWSGNIPGREKRRGLLEP
jgi:hypothetical protein